MAARNWFYLFESWFSWFFQQTSVGKERVPKPRTLTIIAGPRCRRTLQHLLCLPLQDNFNLDDFYNASLCFFPGIVVGAFYLCWIPFMVAVILSAFFKKLITPVVVLVISTLVYSNSAMNPILYGYLNREFRLPYKRLFSKFFWPCK